MLKDSTCHSPNFQHFTDFQITANCLKMLTNSGKKSVTKTLLVYTEISLHSVYITLSHTAITIALQQLTTINISKSKTNFVLTTFNLHSEQVMNAILVLVLFRLKPAKVQKWKCVRLSAIQERGYFFRGGGSTACDVVCLNF